MNIKTRTLVLILVCGLISVTLLMGGCAEKKMEPVPVGELTEYRDPGIGFAIKHPADWVKNAEVGRARFYNAQEVNQKFLDPTGAYPIGVEISVDAIKTDNPQSKIEELKSGWAEAGIQLSPEQPVAVGELSGTKVGYKANFGGGNIISGHHILIAGDSIVFDLGFAGFGDYYEAYAGIFETSLNSFKPPKPKEKGRDETLPAESYSDFDGTMFTFQYPENFNFVNTPKGKFDQVVDLRGVRLDCSIRFDVFDAKGLTVEKVFDQNKGAYKAKSTGKATIGGESALFVNYSVRADVESRAYFVVRNDKVVRITMSWYKPQSDSYVPAYERVINSLRFK